MSHETYCGVTDKAVCAAGNTETLPLLHPKKDSWVFFRFKYLLEMFTAWGKGFLLLCFLFEDHHL
jgi:hypothetical protein